MLAYSVIGAQDLDRAVSFYGSLLEQIDAKEVMGLDRIKFFGSDEGGAMLAVCNPADGKAQSCGNGQMIAIPGGLRKGSMLCTKRRWSSAQLMPARPNKRFHFFTVVMCAIQRAIRLDLYI